MGLGFGPGILLADTFVAARAGWNPANLGFLCIIPILAATLLLALFAMWLVPATRRILSRRAGKLALFGASATLAMVVGSALLDVFDPPAPFHARPPGMVYEFEPDPTKYPGVSGVARATYNSQGVRGTEPPPRGEALRILCVGGGATECLYLDDTETWPALLGQKLGQQLNKPVWVGIAAIDEFASGHHARFLETSPLVRDIDAVIVTLGVNDLIRVLLGLEQGESAPPIWTESRLVGLIRRIWNARLGQGFVMDRDGTTLWLRRTGPGVNREDRDKIYRLSKRDIDFSAELTAYRRRLERLVNAAHARRIRLILVTQPVMWDELLSPRAQRHLRLARLVPYPRPWELLSAARLAPLMRQFHDVVRSVAAERKVALYDAALDLSGQEKLFYDDYHLGEAGAEKLSRELSDYLRRNAFREE